MELEQNIIDTRTILINLGIIINDGESVSNPTQKREHLGFVIDSRLMTVSLTDQRINKLKNLCNNILCDSSGILTVQTLPEFLGTL